MRRTALLCATWAVALLPALHGMLPRPLLVHVLDVGQGDAVLLTTPHGRTVLVDAGPDGTVVARLSEQLPSGPGQLDLLVLSHPHADHYRGLEAALRGWKVGRVLLVGDVEASRGWTETVALLQGSGAMVTIAASGQRLELDGVEFDVLAPRSSLVGHLARAPNDESLVLRVRYGRSAILLTGDLPSSQEAQLLAQGAELRSDVLKVGHHGSASSSSSAFLAAVQPCFAPISVGAHNLYRHPAPSAVQRLVLAGAAVARTDQEGTLTYACSRACCWRPRSWVPAVFLREDSCGTLD